MRTVYRQNFYLIGVISDETERKANLKEQGISEDHIDALISRDKKDEVGFGQQVEKTFHLSDYFIRNKQNHKAEAELEGAIDRFTKLVHGFNGTPPTNDEVEMFGAYSASLKSACLSRQVGAAIINDGGDIISTGCNDVPAYGGGLYTVDGSDDHRCVFKTGRKCFNDFHKHLLQVEFSKILGEEFDAISKIVKAKSNNKVMEELLKSKDALAEKLLKETKAKDLIEYSRAIHAEMDALIQLARTEGQTTVGAKMYTTTYPCHNCARHIVAAGICKVVYIEPYEKSLAIDLHKDAISNTNEKNKVSFEAFEGVAPIRYSKFFEYSDRKDRNTGKANRVSPTNAQHIDPSFLDSYFEYENKVAEHSGSQKNPFE